MRPTDGSDIESKEMARHVHIHTYVNKYKQNCLLCLAHIAICRRHELRELLTCYGSLRGV